MNRDQKAAAIAEIAASIDESHAVFAVDYRGISVPQVAELRSQLRQADATFKVVKNSLTERAADQVGAETLKALLEGPTALTFVRGDIATAAKAIADYGRATQLLPFKGGLMEGAALDPDQIRSLSRLPSREVLYGQLVGVVASPVSGLVRSLSALIGGLASALGQVREKMQSGDAPAATDAPAGKAAAAEETETPAGEAAPEAPAEPTGQEPAPAAGAEVKDSTDQAAGTQAGPENEPAQENDDNPKADAPADDQPGDGDANPKED
jgi:large subunit ribosomal protein L10